MKKMWRIKDELKPMNVSKIEENMQALIANSDEESFIYDLLLA